MKRCKIKNICVVLLLLVGSIDISTSDYSSKGPESLICAGINGKQIQQGARAAKSGWKWLKGCVGCEGEAEKIATNPDIEKTLEKLATSKRILTATELLGKTIEETKASDDVLPKIGEYLSQTKPNEGGQKVITCLKNDANEVRMCLYENGNNIPTVNKLVLGAKEAINLAEYDIQAMQEYFYRGTDGIDYVSFIIPRHPQYILNGKYENRIYECMIFNIPRNIEGGWQRFKEYLVAFFNDILNRPGQLWDEYMFRRGLAEMNINSRDVNEIEQYTFAHNNEYKHDEFIKHIQNQVA